MLINLNIFCHSIHYFIRLNQNLTFVIKFVAIDLKIFKICLNKTYCRIPKRLESAAAFCENCKISPRKNARNQVSYCCQTTDWPRHKSACKMHKQKVNDTSPDENVTVCLKEIKKQISSGCDINKQFDGNAPLMNALELNCDKILKLLLKSMAPILILLKKIMLHRYIWF